MSLSGEGGDLPDKAILKRITWIGRGGVLEAREECCFLRITFRVMCNRTV